MYPASPLWIRNLAGKTVAMTLDTSKYKVIKDLSCWDVVRTSFYEDKLLPPVHRIKWYKHYEGDGTAAADEGEVTSDNGDYMQEDDENTPGIWKELKVEVEGKRSRVSCLSKVG
ncbi:unnamed protein product [Amoebophrya sp. A120]|nr:unnamed protein product [Amoebophrya sp. A120]|eukprot:GSA120T00011031001.1